MNKDAILSENKARIYELCASLFAKEPTPELLRLFRLEDNEALLRSCGIDLFSDIKHYPSEKQAELLAAEYARLFVLPGKPVFLQESLQCGEARLWGEKTVEVNNLYKRFGFELGDSFKDTPDHLSAELSFLAELSKLESKYLSRGEPQARKGVLAVKAYFLKNHLLLWFAKFKGQVSNGAKFFYYREVADFLDMFLAEELKHPEEEP